jgi:hypothetical protein
LLFNCDSYYPYYLDDEDIILFGQWLPSNLTILAPHIVSDSNVQIVNAREDSNHKPIKSKPVIKQHRKRRKYDKEYYNEKLISIIGEEYAMNLLNEYNNMRNHYVKGKELWKQQDLFLINIYNSYPNVSGESLKHFFGIGAKRFSTFIQNGIRRS